MNPFPLLLARTALNKTEGLGLVQDLEDAEMVAQPVPGVQLLHPAWVLSHLSVYGPVIAALASGGEVIDPKGQPYSSGSKPEDGLLAYGSKAAVIERYETSIRTAEEGLNRGTVESLERPMPVERWRPWMPTCGHLVHHMVMTHESYHFGQLRTWRRLMRKA